MSFEEKEKLNTVNNKPQFHCSCLGCAMFDLDINIQAIDLYKESLKLHNPYFVTCTCMYISLLPEQ